MLKTLTIRLRTIIAVLLFSICACELLGQSIDPSFHSPIPLRASVTRAMAIQPDGKILVGGDFSYYANLSVNNLVRLNPDGTLDNTFTFKHDGFQFQIADIEIQSTGDIVVLAQGYIDGVLQ
jgi:hypothetical protein